MDQIRKGSRPVNEVTEQMEKYHILLDGGAEANDDVKAATLYRALRPEIKQVIGLQYKNMTYLQVGRAAYEAESHLQEQREDREKERWEREMREG